jgi:hypothetical protein
MLTQNVAQGLKTKDATEYNILNILLKAQFHPYCFLSCWGHPYVYAWL